jgi:hypothetical protein
MHKKCLIITNMEMSKTFLSLVSFHLVSSKPIMSDFPCLLLFYFSKSFSHDL